MSSRGLLAYVIMLAVYLYVVKHGVDMFARRLLAYILIAAASLPSVSVR